MKVMEYLTKKLSGQYPDIAMISELYKELVEKHNKAFDEDLTGDDKYRPLPLLIGVLYKIQAKNDQFFKSGGQVMGETKDLMELLGYYWHVQHDAGKQLREGINGVKGRVEVEQLVNTNKIKICEALGLSEKDVPVVSVSELCDEYYNPDIDRRLENHCPDFVISIHHFHKAVVFTILGTRIFPRPHPHDIIMDLAAKTTPFHHGVAHAGMVAGNKNLMKQALPYLRQEFFKHEGYSLLTVGYSLGAGLAHLFMMDLELGDAKNSFPSGTKIRAITYGCPPVFFTQNKNVPAMSNITMVSNHNDGITGASLKCINDIFLKTKAIHKLNLKRRTLFKMVLSSSNAGNDTEMELVSEALEDLDLTEEKDNDKKELAPAGLLSRARASVSTRVSNMVKSVSVDVWSQVEEAIENIPKTEHAELTQVGKDLIVIKKTKEDACLTMFSGPEVIRNFSKQIRFKYGMFDNHMPWGYSSLFSKVGSLDVAKNIKLEVLDTDKDIKEEQIQENQVEIQTLKTGLYPDLSCLKQD